MNPRILLVWMVAYAALCVTLGALVRADFYLGIVLLAVARPVLRELGLLADRDERQRLVTYQSSHTAFLLVMVIAGLIFVKTALIDAAEPPFEICIVLFVGLLVKLTGLVLRGSARQLAGRIIAWVIGGAWLLFTLASHGLSVTSLIEAAPWLAVFAFASVARWRPKVGGAGILLVGLATLYLFVLGSSVPVGPRLLVAALVPAPLILAGVLLLTGDRDWRGDE